MSTIIDNHDRQFTFTDILSVNRKDKEYTHIRKVIYEYIFNYTKLHIAVIYEYKHKISTKIYTINLKSNEFKIQRTIDNKYFLLFSESLFNHESKLLSFSNNNRTTGILIPFPINDINRIINDQYEDKDTIDTLKHILIDEPFTNCIDASNKIACRKSLSAYNTIDDKLQVDLGLNVLSNLEIMYSVPRLKYFRLNNIYNDTTHKNILNIIDNMYTNIQTNFEAAFNEYLYKAPGKDIDKSMYMYENCPVCSLKGFFIDDSSDSLDSVDKEKPEDIIKETIKEISKENSLESHKETDKKDSENASKSLEDIILENAYNTISLNLRQYISSNYIKTMRGNILKRLLKHLCNHSYNEEENITDTIVKNINRNEIYNRSKNIPNSLPNDRSNETHCKTYNDKGIFICINNSNILIYRTMNEYVLECIANINYMEASYNENDVFNTTPINDESIINALDKIDIIVHIDKDLRQKIFSILTLNKLSIS